MKLRADARQRAEWERTAAIRRQIYDANKGPDAPWSYELPEIIFNPFAREKS